MEETTYTKEEITRILQNIKYRDFLDIITDVAVENIETPQQLRASIEVISNEVSRKVYTQKDMPTKPKFDSTMLHDAISYQLEYEAAPKDVYLYVQEVYKKDDEWMKKAKHSDLSSTTRSEVAKVIAKQGQAALVKISELGLSIPTTIRDNKTPSKAIRKIDAYLSLADEVDKLKEKVSNLEDRQTISEMRIDYLIGDGVLQPNKQIALDLKKQGLAKKEISVRLGVSVRTISRWFKEPKVMALECKD